MLPPEQGGMGEMVQARSGELAHFTLGGKRLEKVKAVFATEAKGAFADPCTLGNIGGGLIRPFRMVMDYQGGRIAFVER